MDEVYFNININQAYILKLQYGGFFHGHAMILGLKGRARFCGTT